MPAYIVQVPDSGGKTLIGGANSHVVFAADAADARAAAASHFDGDSNALWLDAITTVTEVVEGTSLEGYEFEITVRGANPNPFRTTVETVAGEDAIASGVVNAGGTGYATDDILTVAGGTSSRDATLRVTGQTGGVIDTVEVVDPGVYTVLPSLTANAVTGGTGSSATIDLTATGEHSYELFLAKMVAALNAQTDIAGASVDFSEGGAGARLLTVASGGGGDDIGDAIVEARFGGSGVSVAGLLGTVTDEGVSTAVLSIAIPAVASLIIPQVTPLKT